MKVIFTLLIVLLCSTEGPAQSATLPKEDSGYNQALLAEINRYRQKNGLNQLQLDPNLVELAREHSGMMLRRQQTHHDNFNARFQQAKSRLCVENVGWNYDTPAQLFEGWRRSGGHNRNMLKEGLSRAGIAETGKYVTFFACR